MDAHPDFPRWLDVMRNLAMLRTAFRGTLYRACSPAYANKRDLLTGLGARKTGGRWNVPGSFPIVYLSQSLHGAIAETMGLAGHYGFDPAARLPLTLVAIEADLGEILNLSDTEIRRQLRAPLTMIMGCDWRAENTAGRESLTQGIGRAARVAGLQGLIVPSATKRTFTNLNVFPQNLGGSGSLRILRADRLPPPTGGAS